MYFSPLKAQEFSSSWEKVLSQCEINNKPILLVFSGSDWCGPCIRLDNEVWQTPEFRVFAKQNLNMYRADFPKRKANKLNDELMAVNIQLAEKYNPKGYFPLVVLIQSNKVLATMGYEKIGAQGYVRKIQEFLN